MLVLCWVCVELKAVFEVLMICLVFWVIVLVLSWVMMEVECFGGMRWREPAFLVLMGLVLVEGSSSLSEYGCHLGKREAALVRSPWEILAESPLGLNVGEGSSRCTFERTRVQR